MITKEMLIGYWETKDFPMYMFEDNITIVLYVNGSFNATLWKKEENKTNFTFVSSQLNVVFNNDGTFSIIFENNAITDEYLTLTGELYGFQEPQSFICNVPKYGRRYFEKIK